MNKEFWEILVPASNNKDNKFTYAHHKKWDEFVKDITGGVTIMKTAKGEWVSPTGKLYVDRMIPCRIACTREEILVIIGFTIEHYNQEAVLAYKISEDVILKYKNEKKIPEPPRLMGRIITEGTLGTCPKCGSTEIKKYGFFGKKVGCIQPLCENYYNQKKII